MKNEVYLLIRYIGDSCRVLDVYRWRFEAEEHKKTLEREAARQQALGYSGRVSYALITKKIIL